MSEHPSPPVGLAYLAAALLEAGVEVEVQDFVVFPYSKNLLETKLKTFLPDVVGLTSVTMNFHKAAEVLADVKSIDPDIFTMMGGPHVTFRGVETLEDLTCLDCVVIGEGETAIVELAHALDNARSLDSVEGIVYRAGGEIRQTTARRRFIDMDSLPMPARHLLALGRYRALDLPVTMTASRACPYSCIFCVGRKMFGAKVRFRKPEKVIDEFEILSKFNFNQISFADDLFTAKKAQCIHVCEEIIKRGIKQRWSSFARVDTVSKELLEKMKAAGCQDICFGVESGNPGILKTIKKGINLKQVVDAVKMSKDAGIAPMASFILGLPGETDETLKETVDFARELNALGANYGFHILAPFPGTEVRQEKEKYGLKVLSDDWSRYHANRAVTETPGVSGDKLNEIVIQWEERLDTWRRLVKEKLKNGTPMGSSGADLELFERSEAIYKLMQEKLIEEHGFWPAKTGPASDQDALTTLAEKLAGANGDSSKQIFDLLKSAVDRGDLTLAENSNEVRWEWVDYLS